MNPPANPWTPGEAASVNEFLNSAVGKRWLSLLLARRPIVDITTSERAAVTGAFTAGYDHMLFGQIPHSRDPRNCAPTQEPDSSRVIDPSRD